MQIVPSCQTRRAALISGLNVSKGLENSYISCDLSPVQTVNQSPQNGLN